LDGVVIPYHEFTHITWFAHLTALKVYLCNSIQTIFIVEMSNPRLSIVPPLLNSANPWATTLEDLQDLYNCPYTGAVTTRTTLLEGFAHDDSIHQYTFYNPKTNVPSKDHGDWHRLDRDFADSPYNGSLNTLGYSPIPLKEYLQYIRTISESTPPDATKPIIISVTGDPSDILTCYDLISCLQPSVANVPLAMEINLSCPNIPNKPPPAYDATSLASYLLPLAELIPTLNTQKIPVGLKLPPYTYADQFATLVKALLSTKPHPCPISFLTATNTLGTSLLLSPLPSESEKGHTHYTPTLAPHHHHNPGSSTGINHDLSITQTGLGGLAGAPLHPLALGNVYSLKRHLFPQKDLEDIQIIGVGGVEDAEGFARMRGVGASAVGIGTALGRKGISVFEAIAKGAGFGVALKARDSVAEEASN
jgi:dihydroorotate dehydrogenase (fumarate)